MYNDETSSIDPNLTFDDRHVPGIDSEARSGIFNCLSGDPVFSPRPVDHLPCTVVQLIKSELHILTIVGARPQFIKAAMVSRAILAHNERGDAPPLRESIIHTGQHYDEKMSQVFFEDMGIPEPAANLQIAGGTHGEMTGRMLAAIERELLDRRPDCVLVYGDTNSTLAGALAASKLHIPVAHVEAGLRSFNRRMPEEINRVMTDHLSTLLFCPTPIAIANLEREGVTEGVHTAGDVMYDAAVLFGELADPAFPASLGIGDSDFLIATVHRAENTDDPKRLEGIFRALHHLANERPLVLPLHPRTAKAVAANDLGDLLEPLHVLEPVSFLEMVALLQAAAVVLTDSGGVQKEAYFHRTPCVTLRDETEWVETIDAGWNVLAGADTDTILKAAANAGPGSRNIPEYGDGKSADFMVARLVESL